MPVSATGKKYAVRTDQLGRSFQSYQQRTFQITQSPNEQNFGPVLAGGYFDLHRPVEFGQSRLIVGIGIGQARPHRHCIAAFDRLFRPLRLRIDRTTDLAYDHAVVFHQAEVVVPHPPVILITDEVDPQPQSNGCFLRPGAERNFVAPPVWHPRPPQTYARDDLPPGFSTTTRPGLVTRCVGIYDLKHHCLGAAGHPEPVAQPIAGVRFYGYRFGNYLLMWL